MWSQTARPSTTAMSSDTDVIVESSTGVHRVERLRGRSCGHRQTWTPVPISFTCGADRVYGHENENRPIGFVAADKLRFRRSVRRGGLLDLSCGSGIATQQLGEPVVDQLPHHQ